MSFKARLTVKGKFHKNENKDRVQGARLGQLVEGIEDEGAGPTAINANLIPEQLMVQVVCLQLVRPNFVLICTISPQVGA